MGNLDFISQPPSGDPKKDRQNFERVLGQIWEDNHAVGPLGAFEERTFDRLTTDWSRDARPHEAWMPLLRMALDENFGIKSAWPEDNWRMAVEDLMAEWLLRGPDTMLPLLRKFIASEDDRVLALTTIHDYLTLGPYPLTPEIEAILTDAVPKVATYSDLAAEWLVHDLHDARISDGLRRVESLLTEAQPEAKRAIHCYRTQAG